VILAEPYLGLYAVLDGMVGPAAGDVAARLLPGGWRPGFAKSRMRRRAPRALLGACSAGETLCLAWLTWNRGGASGMAHCLRNADATPAHGAGC
jgi:hypothetical protein